MVSLLHSTELGEQLFKIIISLLEDPTTFSLDKITPVLVILYTLADDTLNPDDPHPDSLTHHDQLLVIDSDGSLDAAVAILAVLADPLWGARVAALTCVRVNASAGVVGRGLVGVLRLAARSEIPIYMGSPVDALQISNQQVDDSNIINSKDSSEPKTKRKNWLSLNNLLKVNVNSSVTHKEHAAVYLSNLVQQNSGPGQGCYHHNNLEAMDSIATDPDSSAFVLRGAFVNNFKVTILPIDTITNSFISKAWLASNLNTTSNPVVNFILTAASLTEGDHWDIHALYAASLILRPNKFVTLKSGEYFVDVEVTGKLTRGVMVTDYYNVTGRKANAEIVFQVNRTAIESVVVESFS
ncbi:hypothetical protein LSTR_LSTR010709 [Laodelphax striatellus]|uniref:Inosine/uridine-preferring nucleoside hydrolase domain-containing protein n=1 Tax=Laodelphax striatellus TaxID=195883 RepID=A0A482WSZ1_LAOST|nr:hypothetical protein LSTR_LSTR010709 [Laodelphax striatellus]